MGTPTTSHLFEATHNGGTDSPDDPNLFTIAEIGAATQPYMTSLTTLEELETRALLPTAISATTTVYIGSTNFAQRVGALTLSFSGAIAASDTDYWTIELQRIRANGTAVRLTVKSTQATGGAAIAANTSWDYDSAVWPASLRYVKKGDVFRLVFTKTGVPSNLTDGCAVMRYEPNVTSLVYDSFTRADNATTLGTSDSGQVWTVVAEPTNLPASVFGIKTNGAAVITTCTARDYAAIDAGVSSCSVSGVLSSPAGTGLAVRLVAGSPLTDSTKRPSGYIHTNTTLFRSDNGTLTSLAVFTSTIVAGDTVTIEISGNSFTVYQNGVNIMPSSGAAVTDATYSSTLHGFRYSSGSLNSPLWDDFAVGV